MPRKPQPPRLYLNPGERVWVIRDGSYVKRTGCGEADREGAEQAFHAYLGEKFKPAVREHSPAKLSVAEVLTAYGREHAPNTKGDSPLTIGYNIQALMTWWGSRTLATVKGETCRAYAKFRRKNVKDNTIRKELSVLSSAINHWHREHGPLDAVPIVTLPEKGGGRERWLTRQEAAYLVAGALGFYRVLQSDIRTRKVTVTWRRNVWEINRHAARFILLALYTGTRHSAVLGIQWMANTQSGWVDLDAGVMRRLGDGKAETKKRQPKTRLGSRILRHMKRWKRIDDEARYEASRKAGEPVHAFMHVVAYNGQPLKKLRRSWDTACELAWLGVEVTPHVLRHTRATWMMQQGIDRWEAAGSLGMSIKTLEEVYGHHHPDWQKKAAEV